MPVVKKPGTKSCYKVDNVPTNKCMTKSEARRQERAIQASKARSGQAVR